MDDSIGSITAGKYADLVMFRSDPLKDIRACRKPGLVMKEGRVVHSDAPLRYDGMKSSAVIA